MRADINDICKMANQLAKDYSFDLYCELHSACIENDLFWCEDINEETETFEFWIEDDHWICEE